MRIPPPDFVAQLRQFPDFVSLEFNDVVGRWDFRFMSAANVPTSQFLGWDKNPLTGTVIEPDGVTGLLPFRDLDAAAQSDILENLKRTFIGNRHDGAGTWKRQVAERSRFNKGVTRKRAVDRAEDFAYAIQQVDLRRPWVKHHQRNTTAPLVFASAPVAKPLIEVVPA